MKKQNEILWEKVEGMAAQFATAQEESTKEGIIGDVLGLMDRYIQTCVLGAIRKSESYGLSIPSEDFYSRMVQYVWEALKDFDTEGKSTFKNMVLYRIRLAEIHVAREYKKAGDETDKDGVTYSSARWDSLDRKIGGSDGDDNKTLADVALGETGSAEDDFIDMTEEKEILSGFEAVNPRYANVIRHMYEGYSGDDLAIVTGESNSNDAKMRKLIQRAKTAFAKYMNERKSR